MHITVVIVMIINRIVCVHVHLLLPHKLLQPIRLIKPPKRLLAALPNLHCLQFTLLVFLLRKQSGHRCRLRGPHETRQKKIQVLELQIFLARGYHLGRQKCGRLLSYSLTLVFPLGWCKLPSLCGRIRIGFHPKESSCTRDRWYGSLRRKQRWRLLV